MSDVERMFDGGRELVLGVCEACLCVCAKDKKGEKGNTLQSYVNWFGGVFLYKAPAFRQWIRLR